MREKTKFLEAVLLVSSASVKKSKLKNLIENFDEILNELKESFNNHGIQILETGDKIELVTREELGEELKEFFRLESEELSPSLLEVLSIISYLGPISRSEIEKLRGVNSVYSLKRLLIIGLIEKAENPHRKNVVLYKPSIDFLKHLGIANVQSLPDYSEFRKKIISQNQ